MSGLVQPEYRPTLRDELAKLRPAARRVVYGLIAVVVVAVLAGAVVHRESGQGVHVVHRGTIAFNLRHPSFMHAVKPASGELLHLQRHMPSGALIDSFVVEPLHLPAYTGDVGGVLPVVAASELRALRKRFPHLQPVQEGKARINTVAGYSLAFRADRAKRLYGRLVLLPEPTPGARTGVKLLLLASAHGGGVSNATDVGTSGQLKTPYRSFRFGTQGP